jgi:hypothetical protein
VPTHRNVAPRQAGPCRRAGAPGPPRRSRSGTGQAMPTTTAAHILRHGVPADADRARDTAFAVAGDVFETQNLSDLTHRQSLSWHGVPRGCLPESVPSVDDCPRTAPSPLSGGGWLRSEPVAGMRRNHRLPCSGIRSLMRRRSRFDRWCCPTSPPDATAAWRPVQARFILEGG